MTMPAVPVVVGQIMTDLAIPPGPNFVQAQTTVTAIVTHIQAMILLATVTTTDTVPGTGLVAPTGGGPVTGSATGTGTGTVT